MIIDSHQHFWKYDPVKHGWIEANMAVLKNDFLPTALAPLLKQNGIDGCIAVQADESEEENDFLLQLAEKNDFIKGIVGWIDMLAEDTSPQLERYKLFKKVKGFRYVLQDKPARNLMLSPTFTNNLWRLFEHGFTYDILIFRDQLQYANALVQQFPSGKFVIDHLAKPSIKLQEIKDWSRDIRAIASNKNVYCKLSGLVTEAAWESFSVKDLAPYAEVALEAFGSQRLLFGSDWPVCSLAASYSRVVDLTRQLISELSVTEQSAVMGGNASSFYNLG